MVEPNSPNIKSTTNWALSVSQSYTIDDTAHWAGQPTVSATPLEHHLFFLSKQMLEYVGPVVLLHSWEAWCCAFNHQLHSASLTCERTGKTVLPPWQTCVPGTGSKAYLNTMYTILNLVELWCKILIFQCNSWNVYSRITETSTQRLVSTKTFFLFKHIIVERGGRGKKFSRYLLGKKSESAGGFCCQVVM